MRISLKEIGSCLYIEQGNCGIGRAIARYSEEKQATDHIACTASGRRQMRDCYHSAKILVEHGLNGEEKSKVLLIEQKG